MAKARLGWLIVLLAGVAGCASAPPVVGLGAEAPTEGDILWRASVDVLRQYQFELDRLDRREGLITTMPMTGASWFELWRRDAVTARDLAESSLQTIHRRALVRLVAAEGEPLGPRVTVEVSRPDRPGPTVMNMSEAFQMVRLVHGTRSWDMYMRDVDAPGLPAPVAVELPEDKPLARQIEQDILARAAELR